MVKRTPLYERHQALGAKMVEFAGWELPVHYSGVLVEHNAVRTAAGIFDVSHMGELKFEGKHAEDGLNELLTNDIRGMKSGQIRYSLIANENGGAVDDVLIYKDNDELFWIVVNAANTQKDAKWIIEHKSPALGFADVSDELAQVAIQGPQSENIIRCLLDDKYIAKKRYTYNTYLKIKGIGCCVSRTGYTGEDGFEIYFSVRHPELYDIIMEAGKPFGLQPCGLGARDTLRLEAGMPLYGHELDEDIPIREAGLDFAIKTDKPYFIGREAVISHQPVFKRIGAKVKDRGIAREGAPVYCKDVYVGYVTSGTYSPTLDCPVCMLRVLSDFAESELTAEVRGRRLALEQVSLPFYKRGVK